MDAHPVTADGMAAGAGLSDPTEVTTRYATAVDSLSDAWAFVMDHLDRVGPDPHVEIKPYRVISVSDMDRDIDEPLRRFGVVVSGMITEGEVGDDD